MTYRDIENNYDFLISIKDKKLPRIITNAIIRNLNELTPIAKSIKEQRTQLISEYSEKTGNGEIKYNMNEDGSYFICFSKENKEKFLKEEAELLEIDEAVTLFLINDTDLDKCELDSRFDIFSIEEELNLSFMTSHLKQEEE